MSEPIIGAEGDATLDAILDPVNASGPLAVAVEGEVDVGDFRGELERDPGDRAATCTLGARETRTGCTS